MKRYFLTCCCLALALVACAPPWKVIPESQIASGKSYQVKLPAGWMHNTSNNKELFISHDGPMLQGMRKPVNDLSRGALVDDIVYTIALTAIQASQNA